MILEEKKKIRKEIKKILENYKINFQRDSAKIMNAILESPEYKKADTILSYMALPDEVFLNNKKFSCKNVFIPKVRQEDGEMDFYKFDENDLEAGAYDILEPAANNIFSLTKPNKYGNILVLVPGRAFTAKGQRLGRGKGYYDKFLDKLFSLFEKSPKTSILTIAGVCFYPQILDSLPTDNFDIKMDIIFSTNHQ